MVLDIIRLFLELFVRDMEESAVTNVSEIVTQHQLAFDRNVQEQMDHASTRH
jgi:hypothetical protein